MLAAGVVAVVAVVAVAGGLAAGWLAAGGLAAAGALRESLGTAAVGCGELGAALLEPSAVGWQPNAAVSGVAASVVPIICNVVRRETRGDGVVRLSRLDMAAPMNGT
jgi:hypothetical protein